MAITGAGFMAKASRKAIRGSSRSWPARPTITALGMMITRRMSSTDRVSPRPIITRNRPNGMMIVWNKYAGSTACSPFIESGYQDKG